MITRAPAYCCMILLALCLATPSPAGAPATPEVTRAELWLDLYTGEPVAYGELLEDLVGADVIFIGEHHTVPRHHRWQRKIIDDLSAGGAKLVVGLEMLERQDRPQLERFNRGEIDFTELAESTNWVERWSNFEDYREILQTARRSGIPVLALNADSDLVRKIGREGLEALGEEERNALPAKLDLEEGPYFKLLEMQLMVHAMFTEQDLRRIFSAQVARDEAMAAAMAGYLKSPEGRGRKAVILCGSGHCSYGLGTVSRLRKRLPDAAERVIILSESGDVELSPEMAKYARDIEISHQQLREAVTLPLGDYLGLIEQKPGVTSSPSVKE